MSNSHWIWRREGLGWHWPRLVSHEQPSQFEDQSMALHSSIPAWKIPWTEEPVGYSPWGRWGSDTTERLHFHFSLSCIGEGNGNPLQCSCLENPRDRGAWWAAVYGVTQSRTGLKWLSSSSRIAKSYGHSIFSFLRNLHTVFPWWLHQLTFPPTV